MYSERDMQEINGRIRKNWLVLVPILAVLLAAYVYGLETSVQWVSMVAGALLVVAACYGLLAYLMPNYRYKGFLIDMAQGLSRDVKGTVVEIGDKAELQDGAMVLPVRVLLDSDEPAAAIGASAQSRRLGLEDEKDTQGERIVYLNASKRDQFPKAGAEVLLHCYGRHVKSVD